ncbi:MAG: hypothetical protein ACXQS2_01790 [Methermicoccaceae archaeon]
MRIVARKGEKEVEVVLEGNYVTLKRRYRNSTRAKLAFSRLKRDYKRQGWEVVHLR